MLVVYQSRVRVYARVVAFAAPNTNRSIDSNVTRDRMRVRHSRARFSLYPQGEGGAEKTEDRIEFGLLQIESYSQIFNLKATCCPIVPMCAPTVVV